MQQPEAPFDAVAHDYDAAFTGTALGCRMRERVWALLPESPSQNHPPSLVLELNCGTGEDAVWLARQGWDVLATDVAPRMIEVTREKARRTGLEGRVKTQVCSFDGIGGIEGQFDLVFSNFGGFNCISPQELREFGRVLPEKLKPGGCFVAVVMSRFCWWETLYFLLKMKPRDAFRRFSREPVAARLNANTTVPTWYYSPAEFRRLLAPAGCSVRICPAGFWLPPSYFHPVFEKHPRWLRFLNFLEQNCTPSWLAPFADHFFIQLKKT